MSEIKKIAFIVYFRVEITMDMIVHLRVEAEVVEWVLPDVSLDEAVVLEGVVEQEVHLEDHIKMKIRYKYDVIVLKNF